MNRICLIISCYCFAIVFGCGENTSTSEDVSLKSKKSFPARIIVNKFNNSTKSNNETNKEVKSTDNDNVKKNAINQKKFSISEILEKAKSEKKKVIIYFRKKSTKANLMTKSFQNMKSNLNDKVLFFSVATDDPVAKSLVLKYGINRVRDPVILVIGYNGEVLAGFTKSVDVSMVKKIVDSKLLSEFIEARSNETLLFVVLGKPQSEEYKDVIEVAKGYAGRKALNEVIIKVDISDTSEKIMLEIMEVESKETKTVTCIFWNNKPAGKLTGIVTFEQVETLLDEFKKNCCPPGG